MRKSIFLLVPFCMGLLILTSCSPGEKIYDVSGTVSYEGKPVPKGLIFFDPASGTPGTQGFANIVDGKYNTADKGKGIRGGKYSVRVNGFDGKEGPDAPFGGTLFPEHNGSTDLPLENSKYDLDIKKKK